MKRHYVYSIAAGLLAVGLIGGGLRLRSHTKSHTPKGMVYSSTGFGGYMPVQPPKPPSTDPVAPIEAAYVAGRYAEAERLGKQLIVQNDHAPDMTARKQRVRAIWVLAYCSARQGKYPLARDRFAVLRDQASELPDHGAFPPRLGERLPTLEEEGAFQYAVCTGALGDKKEAEAEYDRFLTHYPDSILVHAAVKRVGRFHGGNVPKETERLWTLAMQIQRKHEAAQRREVSLCGPECVAELLRRRGEKPDIHALANEMQTDENGTSLAALSDAAHKRGLPAQGLELTQQGLTQQKLPVIALMAPSHYVLVEAVHGEGVRIWDPDAQGPGKSAIREVGSQEWGRDWAKVALAL